MSAQEATDAAGRAFWEACYRDVLRSLLADPQSYPVDTRSADAAAIADAALVEWRLRHGRATGTGLADAPKPLKPSGTYCVIESMERGEPLLTLFDANGPAFLSGNFACAVMRHEFTAGSDAEALAIFDTYRRDYFGEFAR